VTHYEFDNEVMPGKEIKLVIPGNHTHYINRIQLTQGMNVQHRNHEFMNQFKGKHLIVRCKSLYDEVFEFNQEIN